MIKKDFTCCVFGHRKINKTAELTERLTKIFVDLIEERKVKTFLFGSKSEFDSLCLEIVSDLKSSYPNIKRIYVRSSFADIDKAYESYLLEKYEETYFPEKIRGAGKAAYVERNQEVINKSDFCVVYYDENYLPPQKSKSGTAVAYNYALKKKREIVNVFK